MRKKLIVMVVLVAMSVPAINIGPASAFNIVSYLGTVLLEAGAEGVVAFIDKNIKETPTSPQEAWKEFLANCQAHAITTNREKGNELEFISSPRQRVINRQSVLYEYSARMNGKNVISVLVFYVKPGGGIRYVGHTYFRNINQYRNAPFQAVVDHLSKKSKTPLGTVNEKLTSGSDDQMLSALDKNTQ